MIVEERHAIVHNALKGIRTLRNIMVADKTRNKTSLNNHIHYNFSRNDEPII